MIKGTIKEEEREVSLCPLTGEILDWHSFGYYKCLQLDCSQVDKLDWKQIYGHAYRCEVEKDEIIDNLKKQQEWEEERAKRKAAMDAIFKGSLENARTIDLTRFIMYCDAVDQRINETIQSYNSYYWNSNKKHKEKHSWTWHVFCNLCYFRDYI